MLTYRELKKAMDVLSERELDMPATVWDYSNANHYFINEMGESDLFTDGLPILEIDSRKHEISDAVEFAADWEPLEKLFEDAVEEALHVEVAPYFKSTIFDFAGKRLISATNTSFVLHWAASMESPENSSNVNQTRYGGFYGTPVTGYVYMVIYDEPQYLSDDEVFPIYPIAVEARNISRITEQP